jgi:hypothetical protein
VLQPTAQPPQVVGTFWISHGRARKRYVVEVRAPTGQSSVTLPENSFVYGRPSNVVMIELAPRFSGTSCVSPETSSEKRVQR